MTREEAIDRFKEARAGHKEFLSVEALNMAIQALSQEPYEELDFVQEHKKIPVNLQITKQEPCEDCISRREAIKMFTYNYKGERIPDYDCDNFPVQIAMKTVKEMLRELPPVNLQEPTGWIPVSERLPESQVEVIVSCTDDSGDAKFRHTSSGWITTDKKYWIVDNEINCFVTAWMPLPEPYKEK